MTRFGLSAALFLAAWPHAGSGQTVEVRSGEHEDFTRLVFNLPERLDVALRYDAEGVVLSFGQDGLRFDTSSVFERVPTTRLTAMEADERGMALSLACKCDVSTFWASDRAFVVDIGDETELSAALFPMATPAAVEANEVTQTEDRSISTASDTAAVDLNRRANAPSIGSVAFLIADAQDRLDIVRPEDDKDFTAYADRVRDSQDAIIEQIGRAATQGLLSPRNDLLPQNPEPSENTPRAVMTSPAADAEPQGDIGQNITLSAQTSVDQAVTERLALALNNSDSSGCLKPARVDAAKWGGEGSFADQIGLLRSKTLGEFDQPSDADIIRLARFYVHYGFGVEAKQVARLLPNGARLDPAVTAMIAILERGHDIDGSILAGQMDCEPVVAVWSLLSYKKVPGNQPIDPDGIVRGFLKMPVHLRAYLGPIVGTKLRQAGHLRAADQVARALIRNDDTMTSAAEYLKAQSSGQTGAAFPVEADLNDVVSDNTEPSADALLQLIESRLARNDVISEEMAVLAGAYAMEFRNEPAGPDLGRAYLLSLASSRDFDAAFTEYARLSQTGPTPTSGTLSEIVGVLAQNAQDPIFLTHAMRADQRTRFSLDDNVGNAVAERLISLGFHEAAERFVAPMARGEAERSRKLLRAEIALRSQRPRQAELELIGETGEGALQLLAKARSMAGEHSAAQDMYARIDEDDEALRQAWLDGDWQTLQAHQDPAIAAVATRQAMPDVSADPDVAQVLARNSAMIEDSQSIRSEIEALLAGITVPAPLDLQEP